MSGSKILRLIGASGTIGLVLLALALISPITPEASHAIEIIDQPSTSTRAAAATVYVQSQISVAVNAEVWVDITPHATSTFNSNDDPSDPDDGPAVVSISTNNKTGYSLYMHTTSAGGKLTNADKTASIDPMVKAVTASSIANAKAEFEANADFADNTWGYSTNGTKYQAVPTSASSAKIAETEAASTNSLHNVYLGAKIDAKLATGNYVGNIIFSALANPVTLTINDITTMQQMRPEICATAPIWASEADSKTLTDTRDGETYKVARLKDGNCWMQENLKLTLDSSTLPLVPATSDVRTNVGSDKLNTTKSSSLTITNTTDGAKNSWIRNNTDWYYQWGTATAASGMSLTADGAEAADSICPKGWQLPLAGVANPPDQNLKGTYDATSGSFAYLLKQYGVVASSTYSNAITTIVASPLNFISAGRIWADGTADYGGHGYYWSRVLATNTMVYYFRYAQAYIYPSLVQDRYVAQSIRCIARKIAR